MVHKVKEKKINELLLILTPCLKRKYINGAWKYETTWGNKTIEGLRATIKNVLESDENGS